jgi:hypothetical protein
MRSEQIQESIYQYKEAFDMMENELLKVNARIKEMSIQDELKDLLK